MFLMNDFLCHVKYGFYEMAVMIKEQNHKNNDKLMFQKTTMKRRSRANKQANVYQRIERPVVGRIYKKYICNET